MHLAPRFAPLLAATILATVLGGAAPLPAQSSAAALLDTALARMGGADRLRRVERARYEAVTQWQRTSFDDAPYADQPSYELHSDLRDYALGAWRNTRRFSAGDGAAASAWREMTDVVRDSVAARRMGAGPWAPLSVAYVDERRELFAVTPDRLLLAVRDARDARTLGDTAIGGAAHARVAATVDGFPAVLHLRRRDGLPAMVRLRAAQPNDFGLAPWGAMDVEVWYSRWQRLPGGVSYPMQWDVRRVGRPYKRVTLLSASLDAVAPADSFAVSDSLRAAFAVVAAKPMYDLPLDSARLVEPRLASFGTPGAPSGAVRLGRRWVLLESGTAPLTVERAARWLARTDSSADARPAAAILATPMPAQGGAAWLAEQRVSLLAAPGAQRFVATILRNRAVHASAASVDRGRWLHVDGDSLRVEPIDLPDLPGALVVYVPSLSWVYCGTAASPLHLDDVLAHARRRGWTVTRVGPQRGMAAKAG